MKRAMAISAIRGKKHRHNHSFRILLSLLFFSTFSIIESQTITYPEFTEIKPPKVIHSQPKVAHRQFTAEMAAAQSGETAVTWLYVGDIDDTVKIQIAFFDQKLEEEKFIEYNVEERSETKIAISNSNEYAHFYKLADETGNDSLFLDIYDSEGNLLESVNILSSEKIEGIDIVANADNGFVLSWCEYSSYREYDVKTLHVDNHGAGADDPHKLFSGINDNFFIDAHPTGIKMFWFSENNFYVAVFNEVYNIRSRLSFDALYRITGEKIDSIDTGLRLGENNFDLIPKDEGFYICYLDEEYRADYVKFSEYDENFNMTDSLSIKMADRYEHHSKVCFKENSNGDLLFTVAYPKTAEQKEKVTFKGILDKELNIIDTVSYEDIYPTGIEFTDNSTLYLDEFQSLVGLAKVSEEDEFLVKNKIINNYEGYSDEKYPSIVELSNGNKIVSWQGNASMEEAIYVKILNSDGESVTEDIFISEGFDPEISSNAEDKVLLVWHESETGNTLFGQYLNADGEKTSQKFIIDIIDNEYMILDFSLQFLAEDKYIINWYSSSEYFKVFDTTQTAYSDEVLITGIPTKFRDIEKIRDDNFLFVWHERDQNEDWKLYVKEFDISGKIVDSAETFIEYGYSGAYPALIVNDDNSYGVSWYTFRNEACLLKLALFSPEHELIKKITVDTLTYHEFTNTPQLMRNGDDYVISSITHNGVYVYIVSEEGTVYNSNYFMEREIFVMRSDAVISDGKINLVWEDMSLLNPYDDFNIQHMVLGYDLITGIKDNPAQVTNYHLSSNYPNPFNPSTNIEFSLVEKSKVTLSVYDILGRKVATLVNGELASGIHRVNFDGSALSSGIYLYRIDVTGTEGALLYTDAKKMMMIK